MAESVVKLRVDSQEYDSKIKRAAQNVLAFGENCQKAGQSMAKADKEAIEYVRSIGQMETVSKNVKGKIGEMTTAFTELSVQYKRLTDEEKNSPYGKALSQSISDLKNRIIDSKKELAEFNKELEITSETGKKNSGILEAVAGKFGVSSSVFTKTGLAVAGVGLAFKLISDNVATAKNFELAMSQLSSLTGKTGEDLEQLKEYAIELGSTTTLSASEVADAFKMIGSQQPQLLASSEALKDVTKSAITLSEAAGIDLATASQTLSTSINQFGGDSANATRFVNVLAAASQKGAGDISFLGEAITKSGVLANAVGVSYEELVANLEQLAQAGIDASTSGTALRGIIANLEKQNNDQFKPSVVGLTEAFSNLNEAQLTTVDYIELCGKQFFSQAMVLAENADKSRELTKEITGTNTAEEQAKINTDNLDGSLKSLASAWEGLNLHINSSNGFLKALVDWLATAIGWVDKLIQKLNELYDQPETVDDVIVRAAEKAERERVERERQKEEARQKRLDEENARLNEGKPKHVYVETRDSSGKLIRAESDGKDVTNLVMKNEPNNNPTPKVAPPKKNTNTGRGRGGGGGHKVTPAEKAQQMVEAALASYAQTITEADLRMEAGLDDTLDHKKKELAAQQRLFEAYGKAYAIYSDPKYKASYAEAADRYKSLAKTVKETEQAMKEEKEWLAETSKSDNGVINTGYVPTLDSLVRERVVGNKMAADEAALSNLLEVIIKNGIEGIDLPVEDLQRKIEDEGISDDFWEALVKKINKKLKEKGRKNIDIDTETGAVTGGEKKKKKEEKVLGDYLGEMAGGISSITGGLEDLGIKVPDGISKVVKYLQATQAILTGISTVVTVIMAIQSAKSVPIIGFMLAGGGVVRGAGGLVGGRSFSGDNVPALLNSGEVVLNRAEVGVIANALNNGGIGNLNLSAEVSAEKLRFVLNNNGRRTGRGEIAYSH